VDSTEPTTVLASTGYGRRVGLRVPTAEVEAARAWLPFWWDDAKVEPEKVWDAESATACERVVRDLELWVAEHSVDMIFVHAGVVAIDGEAILLPGRSYSGKSTLVVELLKAGAMYGSDEYAVIDTEGLVHPYPRPISLRDDSGRPRVKAAALGAATLEAPIPVRIVAMLRYEPTAEWEVQALSPAEVVLGLLENTVAARTRSDAALGVMTAIAGRAIGIAGVRGHALTTAHRLSALS
jgi:hypothetical protein